MKDYLKNKVLIDLTHSISSDIPHWNTDCGFQSQIILDYDDCPDTVKFRVQKMTMYSGIGTHIDAPIHCIQHGKSVSDIPLENLIAPCVVINVSNKTNENYSVIHDDITHFENQHGLIASGTFAIIQTEWGKYWDTPNKYRNNLVFPSLSKDAGQLLLDRQVVGIGIDTLSPDRAEEGFPIHQLMLGAGKYIIENVANAHLLPPTGAYVIALPIKIQGGTEAPVRLIGIIDQLS